MRTNNVIFLILISISVTLFSCDVFDERVSPSSNITIRNESFDNYSAIEASHAFQVYVNFSDTEETIEIEANDNLHQYIEVSKVNNTLKIRINNNINIRGSATLKAYITTKQVSSFSGSGATQFAIESPVISEDVDIHLSGASIFNADIGADHLMTDISGASILNLTGSVQDFYIEASGASLCRDYGFEADRLIADLSGASDLKLTVHDEIDIEASGASNLKFKGDAVIKHQDISGASNVKRVN